jgi:hypothetical protein
VSAPDLASVRDLLAGVAPASQAEAIAQLRALEEVKSAAAAAQAKVTDALVRMRHDAEERQGIPAKLRGRGLDSEVALARMDSPAKGSRHLGMAMALTREMPRTLEHLAAGRTSEWRATLMVRETACLPAADRRKVDERLSADLPLLGDRQVITRAKALAIELDESHALRRAETERNKRGVSVRPAAGDMAYLTAYLPMTQAVRAYASLHAQSLSMISSGKAEGRTKNQLCADLLLERLTGKAASTPQDVALTIVMTDHALAGSSDQPAWLPGHGPLAATIARHHVQSAASVFYRRLWTDPAHGGLVSTESRAREFTGQLRQLILLRDDVCASPYCNAPIRHIDHATPHAEGGPTSQANASGLCERCNHTKHNPGWTHTRTTSVSTGSVSTGSSDVNGVSSSRDGADGAMGSGTVGGHDASGAVASGGVAGGGVAGGDLTVTTPTGHTYHAARSILPARAPKPPPPLSPDAITSIRNRFGTGNTNRQDDPVFKKKPGQQPLRRNADQNNTGRNNTSRNKTGGNVAGENSAGEDSIRGHQDKPPD